MPNLKRYFVINKKWNTFEMWEEQNSQQKQRVIITFFPPPPPTFSFFFLFSFFFHLRLKLPSTIGKKEWTKEESFVGGRKKERKKDDWTCTLVDTVTRPTDGGGRGRDGRKTTYDGRFLDLVMVGLGRGGKDDDTWGVFLDRVMVKGR